MNARQLITGLTHMAKNNGVNLEDLEVFYRYDFDSDSVEVDYVFEDLFDEVTNNRLESVVLTTLSDENV